jgi:2-methylfumaryl-CoA isomerase
MYDLLTGLTVVEGASFIAGPSCALHLQQLGARVIRFDMIGGGPDYSRWPLAPSGNSLYWEGLNKGKQSIAIDLSRPEGRELAVAIVTAAGPDRGLFVTNYPVDGFLAHERLTARRADLITLRVMGWPDGRNAVDYTVNAAVGVPLMTGPGGLQTDEPVNSVLPAWDIATGSYGAFALLAAERRRRTTGRGGEIKIALSDVAIGMLAHMGQVAEAKISGDRRRSGNSLFGAFGCDFQTRDGKRVMIVAITSRQWTGLVNALSIGSEIDAIEKAVSVDFAKDEGARYTHFDKLRPVVAKAIAERSLEDLRPLLDRQGVCWERYRSLGEAISDDPRLVAENEIFASATSPSGEEYPIAGAFARLSGESRDIPRPAPRLGENTEEILADYLSLPDHDIARLYDLGIVASAQGAGERRRHSFRKL